MKQVWLSSLFLMVCFTAFSGNPDISKINAAKKQFPNADAIFLKKNTDVKIELVDGEPKVSSSIETQILFATDKSDFYRNYAIYHGYFTDVTDLKALTLANYDGKYKEVKVEEFTTMDNVSANIFYDDLKEVNFVFPAVTAGSVGTVTYKETLKDAHFMSPFYFVSYMPIIESNFTVTCPSSVRINYRIMNNDSNQVLFTKEEKGKNVIYTWSAKNVKNKKSENGSPAFAYYAPHVLVTISDYTVNGKTTPLIPDVKGLCEWYKTFVKDINKDEDSLLVATVTDIVKGAKDDEEKVKRIYYWVQDNINYIAFEDGMNGFIPREAAVIFQKRYGDCKDMSSLLVKMLRTAGIKAYHTWIGSRRLPYKYSDLACPNIDDHMICVADANGKRFVLDGTGKYTPIGFVTDFIQGKESLVLKDDGNCEIYQIPVMPKEKSTEFDTITISIDADKKLVGSIKAEYNGYYKIDHSYMYHYTRPEKRDEKFSDYMKTGNNKCKITDLHYQGFYGQDSTMRVWANYELPDYAKFIGNKIYLNPSLEKAESYSSIDMEDRTQPLELDYKGVRNSITIINIPEGYKVDYQPEDVNYKSKHTGFELIYKQEGNKLIQTKKIVTDFILLSFEDLNEWNDMVKAMNKAFKENIVFIKN